MDKINQQVFAAIEEMTTIRIISDLPTDSLDSENFLASASERIKPFMAVWEGKAQIRLLAVDAWPDHTYIAVDINNFRYDFDTAHKQLFALPVYILRQSKRSYRWKFFRRAPSDGYAAKRIADLHLAHGENALPFFENHVTGNRCLLEPRGVEDAT